MSLDDLGNVGEFVGAIAVFVSLIYLALQIRQNTKSLKESASRSLHDAFYRLSLFVAEHPEVAEIAIRGAQDRSQLDAVERLRFENLMDTVFIMYQDVYLQADLPPVVVRSLC